ncbi:MAG: cellulase family glycosylhydrolase [Lentisphaeria bacterium]|nr:cellulase family glycosylhydrolase [Lentisphaeria bacterium]
MQRLALFCLAALCVPEHAAAAAPVKVEVTVDCGRVLDGDLELWGCVNVSRRAPPPPELCAIIEKEFGQPKVTRCWLMLDEMWDYRSGQYRFDYEINRDYYEGDPNKKRYGVAGVATGLHYYDYIDAVSRHSDTVLLNIRRYEQEVLSGMLTVATWKEVFKSALAHYKARCPNLRYVEVLNEPTAKNQSNIGSMKEYYRFYRSAYEAVKEVNQELKPELPLLVGGTSGFRTAQAIHLAKAFARDPNPAKRLDFLSFHHYWAEDRPCQVGEWEKEVDDALAAADLSTDLPIFVTEIGYANRWMTRPDRNLWQACGMTAFQFYARRSPDLRLFPWVQYHSKQQIAFVQFDTDLRMTPYGAAVRMLRLHRRREVAAVSRGLDPNGNGLGVLATMDENGLVVHLWNLQPDGTTSVAAEVTVANLPPALRQRPLAMRRYLIDSTHGNGFAEGHGAPGLEQVETGNLTVGDTVTLTANLEPMALCLWQLDGVPGDP